ncbi:immunity 26/phosphotriesterase HocA family protein [Xanthomonas sacchari]|uniref:immunity 26/phosphotriesterase HocA family protein n=1 Tax=Xanthomonas sacchari TaxID=56458 RepID=UPI001F3A9CB1|nr:immunity 26/phosphotriesterase HocA family protein [Xanthomonas sacchari]
MAVKYRAGDVFAIPLDTGTYALCQVLWAPQGDYRQVVGFCVLERHASTPALGRRLDSRCPCATATRTSACCSPAPRSSSAATGRSLAQIIGHAPLPEDAGELLTFHIAGELHEGDTFVRMLSVDEYARYPSMSVLGFELVHRLLSGSQ